MDTAATLEQYNQDLSNLPAELQHLLSELGTNDCNMYEIRKKLQAKDGAIHKFIKQHGSLTKNPKENQLYPRIREDFKKMEETQKEKCITANTALFLTAKHLVRLESDIEKLKSEGLLALDDMEIDSEDDIFTSRGASRSATAGMSALSGTLSNGNGSNYNNIDAAVNGVNAQAAVKKQSRKSTAPKSVTPVATTTAVRPMKRQRTEESKSPAPKAETILPAASTNLKSTATKAPKIESTGISTGSGAGTSSGGANEEENELYCFCQRVSFGEMVGCDNDDCKFEWFHYECVGLKEPPKGKWFCPDCVERQKLKENKKKRKL